jgi:hypothetical protein
MNGDPKTKTTAQAARTNPFPVNKRGANLIILV